MSFNSVLSGVDLDREVRFALSQFVDKQKTFSAHDVSQQIRKNVGLLVEVRHEDVRPIVHDLMFNDMNYNKVFDGTKFVYKSNLNPINGITPIGVGALQVASQNSGQPPVTKDNGSMNLFPRSEGRVTVPATLLKQIGVQPDDVLFVHVNQNEIRVAKKIHSYPHHTFKADKYGSFRIRKNIVNDYRKFNVRVDSQDVVLVGTK